MFDTDELYTFLNYVENLPGKGTPKHSAIVLKKAAKELGGMDAKPMLKCCIEHHYLRLLPGIKSITETTTVIMTRKGHGFLSQQRLSKF